MFGKKTKCEEMWDATHEAKDAATARYEAARCQAENALQLAQDLKSDRFALEVGARYNMATIHHAWVMTVSTPARTRRPTGSWS